MYHHCDNTLNLLDIIKIYKQAKTTSDLKKCEKKDSSIGSNLKALDKVYDGSNCEANLISYIILSIKFEGVIL